MPSPTPVQVRGVDRVRDDHTVFAGIQWASRQGMSRNSCGCSPIVQIAPTALLEIVKDW